ncbi:MoaD/ThiS family protein [Desulfovibrio ferrophilus]|uniref:ThiamineS protein n=1 Tax=Desulfovibrio ferrophilus TaxID=241368 RepID=A0A2Z6B1U1_9BACT|nr:MoaD/ThiS family protein [Desulfovibrio ferrophilus]BBD09423.1 thiamineS protein [Desulfovibrio ferrophilus]
MKIDVKCFATLAKFQPEVSDGYEAKDGATIAELIDVLGIDPAEVKIIFLNGKHSAPEVVIAPGDRVGLFPAVGGG